AVEEVMFQCSKALVRSRLWDDDYRVDRKTVLPTLGKMIKDQIGLSQPAEEVEGYIQTSVKERLY
ncbi:MAG: pyridoxamine 5'-phosphate oxidase family protein, partial [Alphaproteobacteria bacterium]